MISSSYQPSVIKQGKAAILVTLKGTPTSLSAAGNSTSFMSELIKSPSSARSELDSEQNDDLDEQEQEGEEEEEAKLGCSKSKLNAGGELVSSSTNSPSQQQQELASQSGNIKRRRSRKRRSGRSKGKLRPDLGVVKQERTQPSGNQGKPNFYSKSDSFSSASSCVSSSDGSCNLRLRKSLGTQIADSGQKIEAADQMDQRQEQLTCNSSCCSSCSGCKSAPETLRSLRNKKRDDEDDILRQSNWTRLLNDYVCPWCESKKSHSIQGPPDIGNGAGITACCRCCCGIRFPEFNKDRQ